MKQQPRDRWSQLGKVTGGVNSTCGLWKGRVAIHYSLPLPFHQTFCPHLFQPLLSRCLPIALFIVVVFYNYLYRILILSSLMIRILSIMIIIILLLLLLSLLLLLLLFLIIIMIIIIIIVTIIIIIIVIIIIIIIIVAVPPTNKPRCLCCFFTHTECKAGLQQDQVNSRR